LDAGEAKRKKDSPDAALDFREHRMGVLPGRFSGVTSSSRIVRVQRHLIAELLQAAHQAFLDCLPIPLIKIIAS
jgi:hypothetical protein